METISHSKRKVFSMLLDKKNDYAGCYLICFASGESGRHAGKTVLAVGIIIDKTLLKEEGKSENWEKN